MPLYHPLDGQELLKWILHELQQNLPNHYIFSPAMAYHNPTFNLKLTITSWSPEGTTKYPVGEANVEAGAHKVTSQIEGGEPAPEQTVEVNFTEPLYAPDKARDAAKLGRYKTERVAGVLADVKDETKRPAEVPAKGGGA
jgi:hypothetical protein